jgi:hypothetical protein
MAYFAEIDESSIVTRVIAVSDEDTQDENGNEVESIGAEFCNKLLGGTWKQTSFNTANGIHSLGGTPFRVNHASIGYSYDKTLDAFIPPQPYPSWILDENICQWDPPVEKKDNVYEEDEHGNVKLITQYQWNEDSGAWEEK